MISASSRRWRSPTSRYPKGDVARRTGGSTPRFRQNRLDVVLHGLVPERGRVPVVVYRQVCLGLQPLAWLVYDLYPVK